MQVGLSIRYGHDTIRVVDPTTMLIEYVCDIPIREGLVIVENAFQKLQHQLDYRDFHTMLSEAKRVPGASKARYIADIYESFIGIASRNVGAFGIFRCGLKPVQQYEISAHRGVYRADAALVKEHLVVEADGALKYQSGQDIPDGKTREDAIRLEGWELVRSTGEEVLHPGRTEQKLRTTTYSVEVFVNFTRSGFLIENPLLAVRGRAATPPRPACG